MSYKPNDNAIHKLPLLNFFLILLSSIAVFQNSFTLIEHNRELRERGKWIKEADKSVELLLQENADLLRALRKDIERAEGKGC